jgi:hypothetical protein
LPIAIGVLVVIMAIVVDASLFKARDLTIFNSNPNEVVAAVRYEQSAGDWKTLGWFKSGPGERKTFTVRFYRITPQFWVYAESNDANLMNWLPKEATKGESGKAVFSNNDNFVVASVPVDRGADIASPGVELEELKFGHINLAGSTEGLDILSDPRFESVILDEPLLPNEEQRQPLEIIAHRSEALSESLKRQQQFDLLFRNPQHQYPYELEFELSEEDDDQIGFMRPGVKISDVEAQTLHGDAIQIKEGDVLLAVNKTPVFAPADAYMALHQHASDFANGGIAVPLNYTVRRGAEILEIPSYYRFNRSYPWDDTAVSAFFNSLMNVGLLGFWGEAKALFSDDYTRSKWETIQALARLTQFFPRASFAGALAGLVVPSPLTIVKLGKMWVSLWLRFRFTHTRLRRRPVAIRRFSKTSGDPFQQSPASP